MVSAVTSPFAGGDIRLRLSSLFGHIEKVGPVLQSYMHVDARDLQFSDEPDGTRSAQIELLALTFGDNGEVADQKGQRYTVRLSPERHAQALRNGFIYTMRVPVKRAGPYQLRIALRDVNTDRMGSATQFIEVPDVTKGHLTLSSLIVEGAASEQPAVASDATEGGVEDVERQANVTMRTFRQGTAVSYGFYIYNARISSSRQPQLESEVRLYRDGKEVFRTGRGPLGTPRHTAIGGNNRVPVWSRDSKRVAFQSDREGDRGIFWQSVDGGAAEWLTRAEPGTLHTPESWSPVDDVLLFSITKDPETTLWIHSLRDRTTSRFGDVISVGVPTDAVFSPDGRRIAYQVSDRVGEATLYVQPFPPTGTKYEIGGGGRPLWSPDGSELFFVPSPSRFMAVTVRTQPTFGFTNPVTVARRFGVARPANPRPYDILPDRRFVAVGVASQVGEQDSPRIEVVVNWFEELKRKQPGAK